MYKKLITKIKPPKQWTVAVLVALGIFAGLGIYSAYIGKAFSYLSDDPRTCVNCHVMTPQYATWFHSSHARGTTCNDCHVPHNNVFNKYFFKAKDGLRHSTIFTFRGEPQVIFIKTEGANVVQENCKRCHEKVVDVMIHKINQSSDFKERKCWECHREVPHGRVNGLSSTPNAISHKKNNPQPEWLQKLFRK